MTSIQTEIHLSGAGPCGSRQIEAELLRTCDGVTSQPERTVRQPVHRKVIVVLNHPHVTFKLCAWRADQCHHLQTETLRARNPQKADADEDSRPQVKLRFACAIRSPS